MAGNPAPRAPAVAAAAAAIAAAAQARGALDHLRLMGEAVAELGAALELAPAQLAAAEARDGLEWRALLPVAALAAFETARLEGWFAVLGDDLALDLALRGLDPDDAPAGDDGAPAVELRAGHAPGCACAAFARAAAAAATTQGDDVLVDARLAIGKAGALAEVARWQAARWQAARWQAARAASPEGASAPQRPFVWYGARAWERLLAPEALPLWERDGLADEAARALVVVCDAAGALRGVALEVIGAVTSDLPLEPDIAPAAWRRFVAREREVRALAAAEVHWATPPRVLTPEWLRVASRAPGLTATARGLRHLGACLAAAFLATAASGSWSEGTTLRLAGARPARCRLGAATADEATPPGEGPDALERLAWWAYASGVPDKLVLARECLARELPAGADVALAEIERAALPALDAARANFAIYVRGRSEQYFRLRAAAQDAVAAYAESVRVAVRDLAGEVAGDAYRTAGLLAVPAVAYLISPALSPVVVAVGSLVYSLYVWRIVLGLYLPACRDRYAAARAGFDARLAAMRELAGEERQRLRAGAAADDALFMRYLARAEWLYRWALALGCVVAAATLLFVVVHAVVLAAHGMPYHASAAPGVTPGATPGAR